MAEAEEAPIHGDILESIFSHMPLIHLHPASRVSETWNRAVLSSLRHLRVVKPWLFLHSQTTRSPFLTATQAFDPRSNVWIEIQRPRISSVSAIRSSHSTLLYMISPSKIVFSNDPLLQTWREVDIRLGLRPDPIVAKVGRHLMIAGGDYNFPDDDIYAIEIYDLRTGSLESSHPIPEPFRDSLASTWLSVAVDGSKMYVSEKSSGKTYSFNPTDKRWCGPYDLRPDRGIFFSVIGLTGERLILVGLVGELEMMRSVKIWEVKMENWECEEMTEIPRKEMEKLKGESDSVWSIEIAAMGEVVFIQTNSNPGEIIMCEMVEGVWHWSSLPNVVVEERSGMQRLVLTCSAVSIVDLEKASRQGNIKLGIKM